MAAAVADNIGIRASIAQLAKIDPCPKELPFYHSGDV